MAVRSVRYQINKKEWCIHLCGGCQPDLGHPVLLSGRVNSHDQQRRRREWRGLKSPCSMNYSVGLYPKVGWITAFKPYQTTSITADKLHCKRKKHKDYRVKSDRKKAHKGVLVLVLVYTLFTSSCCPKVSLKTGAVEEKGRRVNVQKK